MDINEFKKLICKNCGKTWDKHYGKCCDFIKSTCFCPIGCELTDICENCGKTLMEHSSHLYCPDNYFKCFTKIPYTLPNELFEI